MKRILAAALLCISGIASAQKSPEQVFGFRMGEGRKLVKWPQIVDYFHQLAGASNKVKIIEAGKSSEGNPVIAMARITIGLTLRRTDRRTSRLKGAFEFIPSAYALEADPRIAAALITCRTDPRVSAALG
jgi:hypothetical protein